MKPYIQLLFTLLLLLLLSDLSAQATLSEDFEGYNNNDLITIISTDWKLWPKGTDARVTSEEAAGGKNSLKIAAGKNTDLYFPFKRRFTDGSIQMSMDLLVPKGSNGYFSLQGVEVPGVVWSMQCYLDNNGHFRIQNDQLTSLQNAYPQDKWFNIAIDINLESHIWRFSIDGECVGSYVQDQIPKQSVASLALYADGENALFYVDNISFIHKGEIADEFTFKQDAAILEISVPNLDLPSSAINTYAGINGTEQSLTYLIKNTGQEDIKTFELTLETDGKTTTTQEYQVNLKVGADTTVAIGKKLVYKDIMPYEISLTTINGIPDENTCNNKQSLDLHGYDLHPDKKVWVEEATGTWCQFCPRGEVYMNYLSKKYPNHFVGIAVHNSDPMALQSWIGKNKSRWKKTKEHEAIKGLLDYTQSYPSAVVERTEAMDPALLELAFLASATKEPSATLAHSAKWDAETRQLDITITAKLKSPTTKDIRLVVGLTEDNVTGEGKEWGQVNSYANAGQGKMGGYELLPAMVPDSVMVYNDVAKLLLTPFEGDSLEQNAFQPEDSTIVRTFTQIIPGDWDLENMHIVSAISIGSSSIDNANKSTISEAVSNGKNR